MKILRPIVLFFKKFKAAHFWPMIFYMIMYMIWFHFLETIPRNHYYVVEMAVDRRIPFLEGFILPYYSWFPYVAAWCFTLYYLDRDAYDRVSTYLMTGMTVFLLVSTFIPNKQNLRLAVLPRNNIFTRMVESLWRLDTNTNVFPSIHVFNTVAVLAMVLTSASPILRKAAVRVAIIIWSTLICLSTVFIKQHSVFDVIMAILMMMVITVLIYCYGFIFKFRRWDAFTARLEVEVAGEKVKNIA